MGPTDGTLQSISVYLWNFFFPNCDIKAALYADSAGTPGALLATGGPVITGSGSTPLWVVVPISALLVANAFYWLAVKNNVPTGAVFRDTSPGAANQRCSNAELYGAPWSDPFGAGAAASVDVCIYGTYEAGPAMIGKFLT
jgi:hypothetical protein